MITKLLMMIRRSFPAFVLATQATGVSQLEPQLKFLLSIGENVFLTFCLLSFCFILQRRDVRKNANKVSSQISGDCYIVFDSYSLTLGSFFGII